MSFKCEYCLRCHPERSEAKSKDLDDRFLFLRLDAKYLVCVEVEYRAEVGERVERRHFLPCK